MIKERLTGGSAAAEIKAKLRLLSSLNGFVVITLFAFVISFMYEPISGFLDFLPDISIRVILIIVLLLMGVGFYLNKVLSRQVLDIIEQYNHKLDRVLNIAREISEEIYGDILLDKIADCSVDLTRSDAGSVLLRDGENLVLKVVKGGAAEAVGKAVPADWGIAGFVAGHGAPQHIEEASKNSGFEPSLDRVSGYKTRSALCVPLKTKSGVIGVIELLNKKDGAYDEGDVEIVSYLAEQTAISIERAGFFESQKNYEMHMTDILIDIIDRVVPEKGGHSKRVARYANVIARAVGMSDEEQRRLHFASLLHDVGYLKSRHEQAVFGFETLNAINFYKDIAPYVGHHDERYDGTGYPGGLNGPDIPLQSRIIAVADSFDSLVVNDSGSGPASYDAALMGLKENSGTKLDPSLVDLFIENVKDTLG
jgi:putative methionine-R-sulfoxide reductase with GAF domain